MSLSDIAVRTRLILPHNYLNNHGMSPFARFLHAFARYGAEGLKIRVSGAQFGMAGWPCIGRKVVLAIVLPLDRDI